MKMRIGDNDTDDGVVGDDAAAMQMIQSIEPICDKFTIIIACMIHCFRSSFN